MGYVNSGSVNIQGCIFDGSLKGNNRNWGGFIGSVNSSSSSITDCLFKPESVPNNVTESRTLWKYTFVLYVVSVKNSFYTKSCGETDGNQGTQAYTVSNGTTGLTLNYGDGTNYGTVTAYSSGVRYDGKLYTGGTAKVTFTPESKDGRVISTLSTNKGTLTKNSDGSYKLAMASDNATVTATFGNYVVTLFDAPDEGDPTNAETIKEYNSRNANVTIDGRTLYTDGDWNTLCLPFALTLEGSPLEGTTVKTLTSSAFDSTTGTLTLNFSDDNLTSIEAGVPYIVKWPEAELIISSADDWNAFADNVNNGTSYSGKTVKLANDISVTTMVGSADHSFQGTFDGQGHTLTVSYDTSEDFCGPFRYTYGATIKNLTTAGTISTSNIRAGGVVGRNGTGNLTLNNVNSSVTINSSYNGSAYHGGLVAYAINATIKDCAFTGSLLGADSDHCGGLLGQKANTNGSQATFTNCLFDPTEVTVGTGSSYTFGAGDTDKVSTSNCYYTQTLGNAQGTDASSMSAETLADNLGSGWAVSGDKALPVKESNIVSPTFSSVTIGNATNNVTTDCVSFIGTYDPVTLPGGDSSNLFLGSGNTLYWPSNDMTVNAFRAYFHVDLSGGANVRAFVLNFGDEEGEMGISLAPAPFRGLGGLYTLDGRKLRSVQGDSHLSPLTSHLKKGVYIYNGKKRVIK